MGDRKEIEAKMLDWAEHRKTPWTVHEWAHAVQRPVAYVRHSIRNLRLGMRGPVTIVCNPTGYREPWLYEIARTKAASKAWAVWMLAVILARIITLSRQWERVLLMADAGPGARRVSRAFRNLVEEIEDLDGAIK